MSTSTTWHLSFGPYTSDGGPADFLRCARLIAAAPTMKEQLASTLQTLALMADSYPLGSATRNTLEDECAAIRAAIAAAEGNQ